MFPQFDEDQQQKMQTLFNTMKSFSPIEEEPVAPPAREVGPFSSLFNYEQEKARQEQSYARREEVNQKIARGNSVVDAFRLITQGLTGNAGATIPKEQPNKSVIGALNDYMAMDREKKESLDRFRMLGLNNAARDLQYQHGLEAEQRGRDFQEEQADIQRGFTAGEAEKGREFKEGEATKRDQARTDQIDQTQQGQRELERQRADQGHYSYQDRRYGTSRGKTRTVNGVEITDDIASAIIYEMDKLYPTGSVERSRVVADAIRNDNIEDVSLGVLIRQNWPYLQSKIPGLSTVTGVTPGQSTAQPQANNQQLDTTTYDTIIDDAVARTDWRYNKKFKTIRDAFMEGYKLNQVEAERRAKQMLGEK